GVRSLREGYARLASAGICAIQQGFGAVQRPGSAPNSAPTGPRLTRRKAPPYLCRAGLKATLPRAPAQVAELVDALVSCTSAAKRGGSRPLLGASLVLGDAALSRMCCSSLQRARV